MRQGAKAYVAANFVSQACALLRFSLLARILGAHELGLAAILILTAQFFQSISDTGSDRFLVQDSEGDTPTMQGFIQFVLAMRGILIAIGMVVFAGLVSALFKAPDLKPALMALGIASLITGFMHLDLRRVQRHGDFRPESIGMIVSESLGLLATGVAAVITHDASAVVYGLILRALAQVLIAHITAKRPYRWAFPREQGLRFSRFAMPLFLNGILLFFASQGDRVLVGNGLGPAALGHYSAVLLLILYPTSMLIRLVVGFYLPQMSRARDVPERYAEERHRLGGRITLLAIAMLAGFVLVAPIATPLLYGKAFIQPLQLFALVGALQTARFMRVWTTTLSNSIGRSSITLANNVARIVAFPVALVALTYLKSLEIVILAFLFGEVAAILTALWLLDRAKAVVFVREVGRVGLFLLWTAVVGGLCWGLQHGEPLLTSISAFGALVATGLLATERKVMVEMAQAVRKRLQRRRAAPLPSANP